MAWPNDFSKKISGIFGDKAAQKKGESLYDAVKQGNLSKVKQLLKSGAQPNFKGPHNLTPLHQAAYWGETEILDQLIKYGAEINVDNGGDRGWTPLHSAAISGGLKKRKEIIDILLNNKADVNKKDKFGWTPNDYMLLWDNDPDAASKLKEYISDITAHCKPNSDPKKPSDYRTPPH